jgi:hypothetical protein
MGVGGNERWRGAAGDWTLNCKGACRPTSSSPSPSMLFLSSRSSSVCSAMTSFRSRASRRRSVTSLILDLPHNIASQALQPKLGANFLHLKLICFERLPADFRNYVNTWATRNFRLLQFDLVTNCDVLPVSNILFYRMLARQKLSLDNNNNNRQRLS